MKICDLHGLHFQEGKDWIIQILNSCLREREPLIQIIHGYHGHAFKDYINSSEFIYDMQEEGLYLTPLRSDNPGKTNFHLDLPAKYIVIKCTNYPHTQFRGTSKI